MRFDIEVAFPAKYCIHCLNYQSYQPFTREGCETLGALGIPVSIIKGQNKKPHAWPTFTWWLIFYFRLSATSLQWRHSGNWEWLQCYTRLCRDAREKVVPNTWAARRVKLFRAALMAWRRSGYMHEYYMPLWWAFEDFWWPTWACNTSIKGVRCSSCDSEVCNNAQSSPLNLRSKRISITLGLTKFIQVNIVEVKKYIYR